MTALEAVMSVDEMKARLEREAEALSLATDDESQALLSDIYERLDALDSDQTEARAGQILHGLGFTKTMQNKRTRDFSGGWRMRIALARALFVDPALLILDEPTNHLDLEACVWLEETLKNFSRILLVISHSQDFMNGVCTNVIHMHQKGLKNYGMFLFFVLFFSLSFILANSSFLFFSLLIDSLSLLFFVNNRR
jgi:ATP-binding cassette subfamily F protein 2